MSKPSRMCWCDDMACRFTDPSYPCPSPRPMWADENGYYPLALDATEKWHGRLFTCSPLLSPDR